MDNTKDSEVKKSVEQQEETSEKKDIDLMSMHSALKEVADRKDVKKRSAPSEPPNKASTSGSAPKRMKTLCGKVSKNYRSKRLPERQRLYRTIPLIDLRKLSKMPQVPPSDVWPDSDSSDSRFSSYVSSDDSSDDDSEKEEEAPSSDHGDLYD